ncbi:hypothetical protein [Salinibacter altiplanensis]|uniref:hypothetical protein n=1 Tax=Salinibacter altiplanensis TaxID=1803181 RepID=UPI001319EB0B|nr:hypothetical protein [Salinibacter altiplanensis]
MYFYRIYGLNIKSEISLPEVKHSQFKEPDVSIFYGKIEEPFEYGDKNYVMESENRGDKYYMKNIGGFVSRKGEEIKIDPEEGAEEKGFRFLILGLAMGLILDQRGTVTFHASAVDLGKKSVAFAGPKGAGKSTAAAAFHAAGYPIITDDLLPVHLGDGKAYSIQGFPHLKLNPTSEEIFKKEEFSRVSSINPKSSKNLYSPAKYSSKRKIHLKAIYILDFQDDIEKCKSKKLVGIDSLKNILNSLYSFQMKKEVSKKVSKKCIKIINKLDVKKIKRPKNMESIGKIVKYVAENVK